MIASRSALPIAAVLVLGAVCAASPMPGLSLPSFSARMSKGGPGSWFKKYMARRCIARNPNLKCVLVKTDSATSDVHGVLDFTPTYYEGKCKTKVTGTLHGLGTTAHGFHVHELGDISASDGTATGGMLISRFFGNVPMSLRGLCLGNPTSNAYFFCILPFDAMLLPGHFNPRGVPHSLPNGAERHVGDMGNVYFKKEGDYLVDMLFGRPLSTRMIVGRGVIVHAAPDDGGQPTGNAGKVRCSTSLLRRLIVLFHMDALEGIGF